MSVKTVQDEARERVARGVELLDEKVPGWVVEIDLDTLDMRDPYACVASQVTGQGYPSAVRTLDLVDYDGKPYGFHAWTEVTWTGAHAEAATRAAEWVELETEWRRVIAERRAK